MGAYKSFGHFVALDIVLLLDCQVMLGVIILVAFHMPVRELDRRTFSRSVLDREIEISIVAGGFIRSNCCHCVKGSQVRDESKVIAKARYSDCVGQSVVARKVIL